jgi:DNA repair exonuclease SbcCD ATPase subunit
MIIHNIKITNFKSIYGTQYFDFDKCKGLVKLSGPIGSGKTTFGEAMLYALYGNVKGQNVTQLVAWNCRSCEVEINLTSKNKQVHIIRNNHAPLVVEINGRTLSASNKRDTQNILEEEIYDVPKLAIVKMCIISFNAFNSLAAMNPAETKQFLDDIFGFKLFTDYNNEIIVERKNQVNESVKYQALYAENLEQINHLKTKKLDQQQELIQSIDIDKLQSQREEYVKQGVEQRDKKSSLIKERDSREREYKKQLKEISHKMTEVSTLGKEEKRHYNTFKSGICPTCGQRIDESHIQQHKNKMLEYAEQYKQYEAQYNTMTDECTVMKESYTPRIEACDTEMQSLKQKISAIDQEIKIYNNSLQLIGDNYDDLIREYEEKAAAVKELLDKTDVEIAEWNEMNELFTKTLRYNLLETLIPHINKSIQFFINKLDQAYKIQYDEEFKPHIFVESYDNEISYNNLSTGQRKSLDLAIIFGVLQNVIANVDCNVLFLDELFSNLDSDARNIMLSLLNENMSNDKTIFVINHAEMSDDYFSHKIRVHLENKKIISESRKQDTNVIVKASRYEQIF